MPIGSPGMEGGNPEVYDVILFGQRPPVTFGRFIGDQLIRGPATIAEPNYNEWPTMMKDGWTCSMGFGHLVVVVPQ